MKYRCPRCGAFVYIIPEDFKFDPKEEFICNRCEDIYFIKPIPVKEKNCGNS